MLHHGPKAPSLIREIPLGSWSIRRPKLHRLDEIDFKEPTLIKGKVFFIHFKPDFTLLIHMHFFNHHFRTLLCFSLQM